ncbi:GDSL-type esterase/lipase family protein [Blastococcus sp. BMG 814]|uniref:GDSL-type esterase/lipase family protein n=1 Tax=Blastococcus carthaginiensis TaxID=3050034 RepID=A0ABT9I9R4_9ACTN|nr:GDSL-type esterase/lipase family protein [Blastococcus carthaginiensis]MDP5182313.1 GDSL-type esterase/lipase family protein [Blastococcus carthaginiensis]
MGRGRVVLAVVAVVVVALAASVLVRDSPTRRLAEAVAHFECFLSPSDEPGGTVALGDSITAGSHVAALDIGVDDSYFDVLGCRGDSPVTYGGNAGVGGERSDEILARVPEALAPRPDTVLVLAGTNDVRQGRTDGTIDTLTRIAEEVEAGGATPVFATLPPSAEFPDETVALNERLRVWADERGVELLDFWTPLADPDGTFAEGMSDDGTHPSLEGAEVLADVVADALG